MKPEDKQSKLLALAERIEDNKEKIKELEPNVLIDICVDLCRFYAGVSRTLISFPQNEYFKGCTSSMRWEPKGHCLGVIPKNYPLIIALWKVAPALAAGCTIDLKLHKDNVGSVPFVLNDIDIVDDIDFSKYDFIDITGSKKTADYFKSNHNDVNADVGGASIAIVADGNLQWIQESLTWSIRYNNGQDCTAAKHIFCKEEHLGYFASIPGVSVGEPSNLDHFNPTATISTYTDLDVLIKQINTYENRLGLHLYTNDLSVQRHVSQYAKWGTIMVNRPLSVPREMPHSGMGASGNTFNQSYFKVYQYLVPKHIVVGDQS